MADVVNERLERIRKIQELKKALAERIDTRVVRSRTRDTNSILLLAQSGDFAMNRIRQDMGNMGGTISVEDGAKAIKNYQDAIIAFAKAVKEICDIAGTDFRAPKWIREKLGLADDDAIDLGVQGGA